MSSNTGRSAKDLRVLVEATREERQMEEFPEDMKANLEKLRALSKDDLTENAMLRSRIDQQAELICILKNRADENLRKAMSLEKENAEMRKNYDDSMEILRSETRKLQVLQRRFDTLSSNHEEMIKLKDEYKTANKALRLENDNLRRDNENLFNTAIEERQKVIESLTSELQKSREDCSTVEKRYREVYSHLISVEKDSVDQISKLKQRLEEVQAMAESARKEFSSENEVMKKELEDMKAKAQHLSKERDELAQLAVERGKKVQDKDNQMKALLSRMEESENAIKELEDKFERESESVSTNSTVKKLRTKVDELHGRLQDQDREFDAYKKHSAMLLSKERELNSKLRLLIG